MDIQESSQKEKQARRVPMQKRAREKYDAVLEACTVVLAREGYNGTTTSNIAKEAGVAIGSLYEYFPNKETIFSAFLETRISGLMDYLVNVSEEAQGNPAKDSVHNLIRIAVKATMENREMLRVVVNEVPGVLDLPSVKGLEDSLSVVARSLAKEADLNLTDEEVEVKTYILANALFGFFIRSFFSPTELSVEEVSDELVKLVTGYAEQ